MNYFGSDVNNFLKLPRHRKPKRHKAQGGGKDDKDTLQSYSY